MSYENHFKSKLAQHGAAHPGHVEDKKAFFNKVDKSWKAKDESLSRAQRVSLAVNELLSPIEEISGKGAAGLAALGAAGYGAHKLMQKAGTVVRSGAEANPLRGTAHHAKKVLDMMDQN